MKETLRYISAIARHMIGGTVVALFVYLAMEKPLTLPRLEFLLDTIISSAATISGFILASVTILVGATSSKIMEDIKNKCGLPELRWRYSETLILGLAVMMYFTYLGVVIDANNEVARSCLAISTGALTAYIYSVITTCYYLLSIIGKINEDPPIEEGGPSSPDGDFR